MKSQNARQSLARRLTWMTGLVLLPLVILLSIADFRAFAQRQSLIKRIGNNGALVDKYTRAIRALDWRAATSYYAGTTDLKAQLAEPLSGYQPNISTIYFLPFSGYHEIYIYSLHGERHNFRLSVDVVASGKAWKIDSVRLSPAD